MQIFQNKNFPNKAEHSVSSGVINNKYLKDTAAELTKDEPKVRYVDSQNAWNLDSGFSVTFALSGLAGH
jgi:hypothetical protein